jgi:hypothetical protein
MYYMGCIIYVSYNTKYRIESLGVKRQEGEADNSPPTSAEVKKACIYTATPPYVFMV